MRAGLIARRIAIVLAGIAASLVLLAVAAIWFTGREATLQMALQRLATASGGALTIEGAQGSLYSPIKIRRIVYENAKLRIEARDIDVDWLPRELIDKTVHIRHVRMAALDINNKQPSDEPAKPPASLRLPLSITIDAAELATLSVSTRDKPPVVM